MRKIQTIILVLLSYAGLAFSADEYGRTVFYGDVSVGSWSAISNVAVTYTTGGAYTNGTSNFWYQVSGTNRSGRLPVSTNVITSFDGSTLTNALKLSWARYNGVSKIVVKRSSDAGTNWQWQFISPSSTYWTDTGSDSWYTNDFDSVYSTIPNPTVPWTSGSAAEALIIATWASNEVINVSNSWFNSVAFLILNVDTQRWNMGYDTSLWSSNNSVNNSNMISAIQNYTTAWNTAVIEATWASNEVIKVAGDVAIIQGSTSYWNKASLDALWASNGVATLNASTDLWNTASVEASWASNIVEAVSNSWFNSVAYLIDGTDTNRWNQGYWIAAWSSNEVTALSNRIITLEGSTSYWNDAYTIATWGSNEVINVSNSWFDSVAYLVTGVDTNNWNKWLTESNFYLTAEADDLESVLSRGNNAAGLSSTNWLNIIVELLDVDVITNLDSIAFTDGSNISGTTDLLPRDQVSGFNAAVSTNEVVVANAALISSIGGTQSVNQATLNSALQPVSTNGLIRADGSVAFTGNQDFVSNQLQNAVLPSPLLITPNFNSGFGINIANGVAGSDVAAYGQIVSATNNLINSDGSVAWTGNDNKGGQSITNALNVTASGTGTFARVGVGTNAPATTLDVNGAVTIRGNVNVAGNSITNIASLVYTNGTTLFRTVGGTNVFTMVSFGTNYNISLVAE